MQVILAPAGVFANRHAILGGHGVHAYIGGEGFVKQGAVHPVAPQRIDPVKHHHLLSGGMAGLHGVAEGVNKGIKPQAYILNIKAEYVKSVQHFLGHAAGIAVHAVHRYAGLRVYFILQVQAALHIAAYAVLHGKQRGQVILFVQQVNGGAKLTVNAGLVGHQAQSLAF